MPEAIPNSVIPEIHIFAEFLNVGAASDGKAIDGFGITDCLGVSRTVNKKPNHCGKKTKVPAFIRAPFVSGIRAGHDGPLILAALAGIYRIWEN